MIGLLRDFFEALVPEPSPPIRKKRVRKLRPTPDDEMSDHLRQIIHDSENERDWKLDLGNGIEEVYLRVINRHTGKEYRFHASRYAKTYTFRSFQINGNGPPNTLGFRRVYHSLWAAAIKEQKRQFEEL